MKRVITNNDVRDSYSSSRPVTRGGFGGTVRTPPHRTKKSRFWLAFSATVESTLIILVYLRRECQVDNDFRRIRVYRTPGLWSIVCTVYIQLSLYMKKLPQYLKKLVSFWGTSYPRPPTKSPKPCGYEPPTEWSSYGPVISIIIYLFIYYFFSTLGSKVNYYYYYYCRYHRHHPYVIGCT